MSTAKHRSFFCWAMAAPAVLLTLVLGIYPMLDTVRLSFMSYNLLQVRQTGSEFVGLENFRGLLGNPDFVQTIYNTILFVVIVVAVVVTLGLALAHLLNRDFRGRGTFRAITVVGWFMPPVVASAIWVWVYQPQRSPINDLLSRAGVIEAPIRFLTDTASWLGVSIPMLSVSAVRVWNGLPFVMVFLLAGLQSIPTDVYEAAAIDGAGPFTRLRYITLPMLRPVLAVMIALLLMLGIGHFDFNYIMTGGGPQNLTNILAVTAYQQAFTFLRFDVAAAASTIILLLSSIVAVFYIIERMKTED